MSRIPGICIPHMRVVNKVGGGGGGTTYVVSLSRVIHSVRCPMPGCPEVAHSAGKLHDHFIYRHFWSQVVVVQEGAGPLPFCDLCEMHMSAGWLIKHRCMARCNKNMQMRWQIRDVVITNKCTEATFSITG